MKYFPEINYINEQEKKIEALTNFVDNQNVWPLLKVIMATSYMGDLENDDNFWLKLLYNKNIKGEERKELFNICKEKFNYYNLGDLIDIPPYLKDNIEKYWNIKIIEEIKQLPIFIILKPALSSDEFTNFLENKRCDNYLSQEEREQLKKVNLIQNMMIKLINDDDIQTFKNLSKNYITYGSIDYEEKQYPNNDLTNESSEKIVFKKFVENKVLINHNWLEVYSNLLYEKPSDLFLNYMRSKKEELRDFKNNINNNYTLEEEKVLELKDKETRKIEKEILKQFKEFIPFINDEGKESIIANTLVDTDNFKLTNAMLALMNTNLKEYKPKHVLLWEHIYNFNNNKIVKILEKTGAELLDFSPNQKQLLLKKYLTIFSPKEFKNFYNIETVENFNEKMFLLLLNQSATCKVPISDELQELLKSSNAFHILAASDTGSHLNSILNYNIESMDVGLLLNNHKNKVKYKDLEKLEKFIVIEQLLEKTWFSPIFYNKDLHYRGLKEKKWTISQYYKDNYSDNLGCFLINEHLSLMDSLNKDLKDTKYTEHYLDFMVEVLCDYKTTHVKKDTVLDKSLNNILDKIIKHDTFDWVKIDEIIKNRIDKNSYIKNKENEVLVNLYTKLSHGCLNHILTTNVIQDNRKKIKI